MAVGDQYHLIGDSGTAFRPSSGVEVIVKSMAMGWRGSSNYFYVYFRTASGNYSYAIPAGAPYTHHTKSQSALNGSDNPLWKGAFSIPVQYTHYLAVVEEGGSHFHISGYITKE